MSPGASPSAVRRANARRAVGSHLNVKWTDASVPEDHQVYPSEKAALQASLDQMTNVTDGVPSLIFVFSDEMRPWSPTSRITTPKPTQQAQDSAAAWTELFQTEGDYSVFIPGRFFNVFRVDATQTKDTFNKLLCSPKAPVVILTDKAGKITDILQGRVRIKRPRVVECMTAILRKDGYIQTASSFAQLHELMLQLEKAEIALLLTGEKLGDAAKKLAKAQTSNLASQGVLPTSGETAKKLIEKLEGEKQQEENAKREILKKEHVLLAELGLPASKMPPDPAESN